jgi:PAS domain S-box-containing protein
MRETGALQRKLTEIEESEQRCRAVEQALAEANQTLQALVHASPVAIIVTDPDDHIRLWNSAATQIFGWSEEELHGRPNPLCPGERRSDFVAVCEKAMRGEVITGAELVLWRKDGSPVDVSLSTAPLRDDQGSLTGIVLILTDITTRKRAEDALRFSEEKFSKIFRFSPDWITISYLIDGRYVDVNEAFLRMTGFIRDEVIGRTSLALGIWIDPLQRNKMVRTLQEKGTVRNEEVEFRMKSGEVRVMLRSADVIELEGRHCIIAVTRDITERKQSEVALRLSEEKFSKAFRSSPDWVTISHLADGRYIDVNDAFLRMTGFSRDDVIGRTSLELGIWADPDQRSEMVRTLQEKGEASNQEVRLRMKSGEVRVMQRSAEVIELGGRYCVIAVTRDITARKQAEDALRLEVSSLRQHLFSDRLGHEEAFSSIVTRSKKMRAVFQYVEVISESQQSVLITGETGVGKELIARVLHTLSGRTGAYVTVNVAGLDDAVFSDTLFGHKKGAYTGADSAREGLIAHAADGTLFLDEIGDLKESSQVKLLRLLQEQSYYPLGSDTPQRSNARIIVATNRDLEKFMSEGKFRKDLYYRLIAHHVQIPPLRERKEDIPLLLDHFLDKASYALNKKKPTSPPELLTLLAAYDFPGNVRELEALVTDAVARHRSGVLSMERFKEVIGRDLRSSRSSLSGEGTPLDISAHFPTLKEAEDFLIREALKRSHGNQRIAASFLGITSQALNKRLRRSEQSYFHRVDESLE